MPCTYYLLPYILTFAGKPVFFWQITVLVQWTVFCNFSFLFPLHSGVASPLLKGGASWGQGFGEGGQFLFDRNQKSLP